MPGSGKLSAIRIRSPVATTEALNGVPGVPKMLLLIERERQRGRI